MARKRSRKINIPMDLTVEILKKLPTKSLARLQCISKQWTSMIRDFIVIDSIVTRSLTQPQRDPHFIFESLPPSKLPCVLSYTYPHHQITNEKQLYHEEVFGTSKGYETTFQYVRGLIGFGCSDGQFKIHNPTTRQSFFLPSTGLPGRWFYLFGYDPLKNQYKVLCVALYQPDQFCHVFTLGNRKKKWRNIQCSIRRHFPYRHAVCINGAIYYEAYLENLDYVLVSFDVRFEKFNHVQTPENLLVHRKNSAIVNYQGKLGCICSNNNEDVDMWVLENAEKQEWFKITFFSMLRGLPSLIRFAGVTHPGCEIVIVHQDYLSEFVKNVYYYDPKRMSRRRVQIQTRTSSSRSCDPFRIWAVTDHVENIMPL